MSRLLLTWAAALCVLAGATGTASAELITTYRTRLAFNAALQGLPLTLENFTDTSHFPISTGVLNSMTDLVVKFGPPIRPGDIRPGVTYSTPIGESFFFNIDGQGGYVGGFLDGFYGGDPNRSLTITFDGLVTGFAFDTNVLMGTSFNLRVQFASGNEYAESFSVQQSAGMEFFGFASDQEDIQSVIIQGRGNGSFAFALDNFTFNEPGSGGVIPEPASLTLLGVGLVGLLGYGWRRRTASLPAG